MKTKKLICGVVAVATAVTMLAGCGGEKTTSSQSGGKLTAWMPLVSNASMVVSNKEKAYSNIVIYNGK